MNIAEKCEHIEMLKSKIDEFAGQTIKLLRVL
jgi:hypothetical protein